MLPSDRGLTLGSPDSGTSFLGKTREDCVIFGGLGLLTADGPGGVDAYLAKRNEMVGQGRLIRGTGGASVEVVRRERGSTQIKLMNGENAGSVGWVSEAALRSP